MSSFKEKSQVFIIGLLVGLIVAGSFFILKLDDYFKELNFYKRISNTFSSSPKTEEITDKKEDAAIVKEKQITENKVKSKKNETVVTSKNPDDMMDSDTLKTLGVKDSISSGSISSNEIVVHKDELLSTKTLEIINLDPIASKTNQKDSLLQKISGIKDDRNTSKQFMNIELWSSPLNYKGYKMSKYKLILYGITSTDGLKLFKLDDAIYIKNAGVVDHIDYASDFRQYERVTDELIINKLK